VINLGSISVGNATLVVANVLTCNKHSQRCVDGHARGEFYCYYTGRKEGLCKAYTVSLSNVVAQKAHSFREVGSCVFGTPR
jgi:hypothetical protein